MERKTGLCSVAVSSPTVNNRWPINSAYGHQDTPRIGRDCAPPILINGNFRQVAFVIESAEAEGDAVLGRKEQVDTRHAAVAQANCGLKKLPAESTLLFLRPMTVRRTVLEVEFDNWHVAKLSTDILSVHTVGYRHRQCDSLCTIRHIFQAGCLKALAVICAVKLTPSLGVPIPVKNKSRPFVIDQHTGQKRKRYRRQTTVDESEVAAVKAILSPLKIRGQRNQILKHGFRRNNLAILDPLAQINKDMIPPSFEPWGKSFDQWCATSITQSPSLNDDNLLSSEAVLLSSIAKVLPDAPHAN